MNNQVHTYQSSSMNKLFPLYRRPSLYSIPDSSSIYVGVFPKVHFENESIQEISNTIYMRLLESLLAYDENQEGPDFVLDSPGKRGNIILDMDGTLGDNIPKTFPENPERFLTPVPIPRPGLKKFFAFVFARYERVSIWTAATYPWYAIFKERVLLPNMPPGAEFHFERTRNPNLPYIILKPLSEIYAMYPEYNESNTTIVDDNVGTFRENRANAVHIPPFFYDHLGGSPETRRKNAAKDRGLYTVMEVLIARNNLHTN